MVYVNLSKNVLRDCATVSKINNEFSCNTCILNAFRLIKSAHVKTQHILVKMAFQVSDYVFIKKVCIKSTATEILNACSLNDQTNILL